MTYDTNGVWRCYEIKVSKSDFHSSSHHTFCGHYNYYVMTKELYDIIKDEVPNNIGIYVNDTCVKRAKKQELTVNEQILKNSMIRSLCRESEKYFNMNDEDKIKSLNRKLSHMKSEYKKYYTMYWDLARERKK